MIISVFLRSKFAFRMLPPCSPAGLLVIVCFPFYFYMISPIFVRLLFTFFLLVLLWNLSLFIFAHHFS